MNDIFENTETMQENEHPRFYTAESVMRGHPDKLCDLIADSVLDACLQHDPASRVACEVMATHGHIIVAGEITTSAKPDVFNIVRDTLRDVGYDPKAYQIDCYIHDQSPDIAGAVEPELAEGEDEDTLGAGDQGVMVGYACNETPEYLPMPVVAAQRLVTLLEISRMTGVIPDIGPDGKVQVVRELQKKGKVVMVGDGINDAPALTRADVGIAIGAGADVALDADVVLMKSSLLDVPAAIRLSRQVLRNMQVVHIPFALALDDFVFQNRRLQEFALVNRPLPVVLIAIRVNDEKLVRLLMRLHIVEQIHPIRRRDIRNQKHFTHPASSASSSFGIASVS